MIKHPSPPKTVRIRPYPLQQGSTFQNFAHNPISLYN